MLTTKAAISSLPDEHSAASQDEVPGETNEALGPNSEISSKSSAPSSDFGSTKFDYWAISAVYFLYFASNSCLVPFLSVFYASQGLEPGQVGVLLALRPAAMLFAGPMAGNIADQLGTSKPVLMVQLCMGAALRMCLRLSSDFGVLCMIVLLAESVASGFAPVMDGHVMKVLHSVGQEQHYGRMRLWGAVGWGLFSVVSGSAQTANLFGLGQNVMFLLNSFIAVFAAIALYRMPAVPRAAHGTAEGAALTTATGASTDADSSADSRPASPVNDSETAGAAAITPAAVHTGPVPGSRGSALRVLLQGYIICFGITVLCMGILMGIITNFLFIWLEQLGAGADVMGWSLFFTCVSEVPLFHYSGALIKRFGNTPLLIAALVCYGIRLVSYSFLSNAWAVLPIELLHGVTFGVGWACCVAFAAEIAPPGLGSTVQGILAGIHWGIGNSIGAIVGGFAYAGLGGQVTWWACEVLVAVGLVAAAATVKLHPPREKGLVENSSYSAVQWDETSVVEAAGDQAHAHTADVELAALQGQVAAQEEEEDDTVV